MTAKSQILSSDELAVEIIPLLDQDGYNTDAEFEQAVADAVRKLKPDYTSHFQTFVRNAIRDRSEFLKPLITEMNEKMALLRASEACLSNWGQLRLKFLESRIHDGEFGLKLHTTMDRLLLRTFSMADLEAKRIRVYPDSSVTTASPEVIGSVVGEKVLNAAELFKQILETQDPPESGLKVPSLDLEIRQKMLHEYQLLLLFLAVATVQERFKSREVTLTVINNIIRLVSDNATDGSESDEGQHGYDGLDDRIEAYNNAMKEDGISAREIAAVYNRYVSGNDVETQFTPEALGLLLAPFMDFIGDTLDGYEAVETLRRTDDV